MTTNWEYTCTVCGHHHVYYSSVLLKYVYCLWPLPCLLFVCTILVLFMCTTLVLFMCTTLELFMCSTLVLFMCTILVVFVCSTLVVFVCSTLIGELFMCPTILLVCIVFYSYTNGYTWGLWKKVGSQKEVIYKFPTNVLAPFIYSRKRSFYSLILYQIK